MLLLFACILVYCVSNVGNKEYGRRFPGTFPGVTIQNSIAITCISLLMLVAGGAKPMSGYMTLLAALYGVVYAATMFLLVFALSVGPMGTTSLICNMGAILSILYGILFCGEKLTVFNVTGAVCMIVVAILSRPSAEKKSLEHRQQVRWFLLTLASTLGNGILACVKKSMGVNHPEVSTAQFMFWAYSSAALVCWILFLVQYLRGERFREWLSRPRELLLCAAAGGLGSGGGTFLQIGALKTLPTIVVFPTCTGLMPVILTLISIYYYKEVKLSVKVISALALCAVGAVLMNL